jgi:branched-subunit amino acid transport protein AzlD
MNKYFSKYIQKHVWVITHSEEVPTLVKYFILSHMVFGILDILCLKSYQVVGLLMD